MHVRRLINDYGIDYMKSSPYHPQVKCQVELLIRHYFVFLPEWCTRNLSDGLIFSFSPYGHILPQDLITSMQAMPFSLCLGRGSGHDRGNGSFSSISSREQTNLPYDRIYQIEALEKRRHNTESK